MSRAGRHEPIRTCIVCGTKQPKGSLVRMALQDGSVVLDHRMRMQGRGAYCCNSERCLELALDNYRHCLNRAFRTKGADTARLSPVAGKS